MEVLVMGDPTIFFHVFDGVAHIMKSPLFKSIVGLCSGIGLVFLLYKYVMEGDGLKAIVMQVAFLAKYIIAWSLIFLPISGVIIRDTTSLKFYKVDNVPYGLSLPASFFTNIGFALTKKFEQAFTPPDYKPYHKYGMVFGSELVAESKNLKIKDAVFWSNMHNYIKQCVIPVAETGVMYTMQDLKTATNVWDLVTKTAPGIVGIEYTYRGGDKSKGFKKQLSCIEAAAEMNREWNAAAGFSIKDMAAKFALIGKSGEGPVSDTKSKEFSAFANKALVGYLQESAEMFGGKQSAYDIIRQQMMVNAVKDSVSSTNGTRSLMLQFATSMVNGDVAKMSLHLIKSVLEALAYACSLFVFMVIMLPGGLSIFGRYTQILLWFQLWGPLFAVLNMFMYVSASAFEGAISSDGMTLNNMNLITNSHQGIVAFSSYCSLMVPFIAKAILDRSGQGLVHLTSSMTGTLQSAGASVANEAATGNLSLDNRSIGNFQYGNSSQLQQSLAASYRAPSTEIQGADGAITKYLPNGDVITQSGVGLTASSGHTRINTGSSFQGALTRGLTHHMGEAQNVSHQLETAEQTTFNKSASHLSQLAERKSNGENIEFSKTSEEGRAVNQALETVKDLHDNYGYSYDQASKMTLNGSLTGNVNVPLGGAAEAIAGKLGGAAGAIAKKAANLVSGAKGGGDIGVGFGGSISKGIDSGSSNSQNLAEQRGVSDRTSSQKSYNDIVRGLASESFSGATHEDQQYSEDISKSYQNVQSKRDSLNHHIEKGKQYSDALTHVQTNHAAYDHDAYDDMQKWMMKKGVSRENARIILDSGNSEFQKYFTEFTDDFVKQNHLMNSARNVKPSVSDQEFAEREKPFNDIHIDRNMEALNSSVKESANKAGLDVDNIKVSKEDISRKVKGVQEHAVNNIASTEQNNQTKQENLQEKVDKEDSKRWVNSKIIPDFLKSEKVFGRKKDKE